MINNVTLVGRPTKDLEVKTIGESTQVVNFTLAVNRPYKNKDGENEADFIQCQAWGAQADFLGKYVKKGQLLGVTGAINTRSYDKDGEMRYVTEVNCTSVQALESKKDGESSAQNNTNDYKTEAEAKKAWTDEWNMRSAGLDANAKQNLKKELNKKYEPIIAALNNDTPY